MNGIGTSTRRVALMLTCALAALCLWADAALASGNLSINNLHSGGPITSTNQPLVGGTDEPIGTPGCGEVTATVFNGIGTGGTIAGARSR